MKNLIEVAMNFTSKGGKSIDENREQLVGLASEMEKTVVAATEMAESQRRVDEALKKGAISAKQAAAENAKAAKEELEAVKQKVDLEIQAAKLSIDAINRKAAASRAAADENKAFLENSKANIEALIKAEQESVAAAEKATKDREAFAASVPKNADEYKARQANLDALAAAEKSAAEESADASKQRIKMEQDVAKALESATDIQIKATEDEVNSKIALNGENDKIIKSKQELIDAIKKEAEAQDATNKNYVFFNMTLKELGAKIKTIALGIAAAAAATIAAIAAYANKTAEAFDNMNNLASKTGISILTFQKYQDVLEQSGVSMDEFAGKINGLNEKILEGANTGKGDTANIIASLGLDIKELAKLKPEEKIEKLYESFDKLTKVQALQLEKKLGLDGLNIVYDNMDKIKKKSDEITKTGLIVTAEEAGRLTTFNDQLASFQNDIAAFTGIVYSNLIPAIQDLFGSSTEEIGLTRDSANSVIEVIIEMLKWAKRIGLVFQMAFSLLMEQFTKFGIKLAGFGQDMASAFDILKSSFNTVTKMLKEIDIVEYLKDIGKRAFESVSDFILTMISNIMGGVLKILESVSSILPASYGKTIKDLQQSAYNLRNQGFKNEKSQIQKNNEAIINTLEIEGKKERQAIQNERKEDQKIVNQTLAELKENADAEQKLIQDKYDAIDEIRAENYTTKTKDAVVDPIDPKASNEIIEIKEQLTELEKLTKQFDIIKNQIALKIQNKDGIQTTYRDLIKQYDLAIAESAKDEKEFARTLQLRADRQAAEISGIKEEKDASYKKLRDEISNLKVLEDISNDSTYNNRDKINKKYDELIAVAKTYKDNELEVNQIIKERKDELDAYAATQKKYSDSLYDMETKILEMKNKNIEAIERERFVQNENIKEMFKNASQEQSAAALTMNNEFFDLKIAKENLAKVNDEITKLTDKRDNQTSVFSYGQVLDVNNQINEKIKERDGLEETLNIKRDKATEKYIFTVSNLKDLLNDTYTNLSTLFSDTVSGVKSLSDASKEFFANTLKSIAKLIQQMIVMKAMGFITNSLGFGAGSVGGTGGSIFHEGGSVFGDVSGTGQFKSMGALKANEVQAVLETGEAVFTEEQQANMGNALAQANNSSGGGDRTIINNIENNIDAGSLGTAIGRTSQFKDAILNVVSKEKSSFKQIINS